MNEKNITENKPCSTLEEYQQKFKDAISKVKIPHKLEIFVEEMDLKDDGTEVWKPVMQDTRLGGDGHTYITVYSKNDLIEKQNWYKSLDQRFKVIREVDQPTPADIQRMAKEQGIVFPIKPDKTAKTEDSDEQVPAETKTEPAACVKQAEKIKPRIVTIGDIQIKYDGDKVYQRQWVRLNSNEAANIRIVNDSNNKLVSMNNRHVEMKRWILIENTQDEEEDMEVSDEQV